MSIFFDFEVGSTGRRFRRAVDGDKDDIKLLLDDSQYKLFGDVDMGGLIELSTLAICMVNAKFEVTGFMALSDRPPAPGLHPAHWETWIRNLFQKFYLARNTLFIHFMCCAKEVEDIFIEEALISVFRNDSYLLHIVLVVPPACPEDCYLKYQTFSKGKLHKCIAPEIEQTDLLDFFYVALRQEIYPKLKIRRAVEEDNDDITALLNKKCPRLKELYGDFYISEIISRHPDMNRQIIVADCQSVAVGVMCLNSDINYEALQKAYELGPYHGLLKTTALEKEKNKRNNTLLRAFGDPIMVGNWSPFEKITKFETAHIDDEPSKEKLLDSIPCKKSSKVYFKRRPTQSSLERYYSTQQSSEDYSENAILNFPTERSKSNHSVIELLEEDAFDYEIINIDKSLLTVPNELSFDTLLYRRKSGPKQSQISAIQENIRRRISTYKALEPVMKYEGKPDAFVIELFGFREDIDERHGFDLLEAAFEMMKQYDYCIMRVPCNEKSFPLLEHFCFVPYKTNVCSEYALYIAHRNSVISKIRVRRAELMDIPSIAHLMQSLNGKETIWTVEDSILKRSGLEAYVFLSGVSLVGFGILEPPENIDIVRARFNLDWCHIHNYHCTGRGPKDGFSTIKAVLVYPVFEPHFRFFIRDMMRQSDVNVLVWLTGYRNKWVIHKANSLAPCMIPLLPRKFELEYDEIEDLKYINKFSNTVTAFAVWFMNNKLTSVPRVNVDTRIVVIGWSKTSMAFINKLFFSDTSTYLFFTNVTLISKNGLSTTRLSKTVAENMFLKRQCASERYLKSVPYTYYLNIIQGTLVDINKKNKYVQLANGSKCYYDMLFLLFGKQYQHPGYLKSALEREKALRVGTFKYTRLDDPTHYEETHDDPTLVCNNAIPENVFVVANIADANRALKYVADLLCDNDDYKIIVYGASIHAYCCLATLIEMKVPGENIIFVEPFPPKNPLKTRVSLFCNDYVDNTVKKMIDSLKIQVYRAYYFRAWTVNYMNIATHVEFLSYVQLLRLECGAFFYYGKRSVDEQAFIAIKKSGMAFSGGIVIDHEFRTQDPAIYAAGPATSYSGRYYAETKRQKYYDSAEVGAKLGAQIINQLNPLFTERTVAPRKQSVRFSLNDHILEYLSTSPKSSGSTNTGGEINMKSTTNEETYKLPEFKKPKVTHCMLPGGLQYLEVRPPALRIPHHYVQSLQYNGYVLETFKTGYFKLHLDNEMIVNGITCLTTEKSSVEIFTNLYGLSAVVLNNVHLRYTAKKLDDFYEFFQAPWAAFLYHDQTDELFDMVKELLPKGQHQGETLRDGLRESARKLSKTERFTADTKLKIRAKFETSPHIAAITDYVIEWISQNDILFPMYLQPSHKNSFMNGVKNNPAFRKRKRRITRLLMPI